jgi:hypothetical protein
MSFKVDNWYAGHTSGTKFYQVIRIQNTDTGMSMAIQHSGANALFLGLGKASSGRLEVEEPVNTSNAGKVKIDEKRKGGYKVGETSNVQTFATKQALLAHAKANYGGKALDGVKAALRATFGDLNPSAVFQPDPPRAKEPKETDFQKHPEWGSW